jgi:hypothetical protein
MSRDVWFVVRQRLQADAAFRAEVAVRPLAVLAPYDLNDGERRGLQREAKRLMRRITVVKPPAQQSPAESKKPVQRPPLTRLSSNLPSSGRREHGILVGCATCQKSGSSQENADSRQFSKYEWFAKLRRDRICATPPLGKRIVLRLRRGSPKRRPGNY